MSESTGYGPELFKKVAQIGLNWKESVDYQFKCADLSEVETQLRADSDIFVNVGGAVITSQMIQKGYRFSIPILESGLRVVTKKTADRPMWSFLQNFESSLWIVTLSLAIVVGTVLWVIEREGERKLLSKESLTQLPLHLSDAFASLFLSNKKQSTTFLSNIIRSSYRFVILVLIAIYIATLTVSLTSNRREIGINGIDDIKYEPIGTFNSYENRVSSYPVLGVPKSILWEGDSSTADVLQQLSENKVPALIVDDLIAKMVTKKWKHSYAIVGSQVGSISYGFLYSNSADKEAIDQLDVGLAQLIKEEPEFLRNLHQTILEEVQEIERSRYQSESVKLRELTGLWVVIGCTLGVATVIHFAKYLRSKLKGKDPKSNEEKAGSEQVPEDASKTASPSNVELPKEKEETYAKLRNVIEKAAMKSQRELDRLEDILKKNSVLIRHGIKRSDDMTPRDARHEVRDEPINPRLVL
eukprot:CAMPEP_0115002440 /NCGR_PEP_ID=MMETSP0216-20121206/18004_1 /TAXON_ID=223996 /ORGANISM="Protocruzia adherens, Strain Boccale" /LENGTH=469 /DNA_ID=CAMNT_0002368029 /DNA_START=258 /DNA_END=1668 /DNA_ORIENTATION=+